MDTSLTVAQCEQICADKARTAWQKLRDLVYIIWRPHWTDETWTMDKFECPYCGEIIIPQYFLDDMDICNLTINSINEPWYEITMPCCHAPLYSTEIWNSYKFSEREMWQEARHNYLINYLNLKKEYEIAKEKYKIICDTMYDRDQLSSF